MPANTKKQHYVPRFYLKSFSKDGTGIYMFDKEKGLPIKCVSIRDVAQEKYFYDLGTPGKRDFYLEQLFSEIESQIAPEILSVLDLLSQGKPPVEYIYSLAFFMVISELRTKSTRNWLISNQLNTVRQFMKSPVMRDYQIDLAQRYFPEKTLKDILEFIDNIHVESIKSAEPSLHANAILANKELINEAICYLLNRRWAIYRYDEEINYGFWTSDTPVIRFSDNNSQSLYGLGYAASITNFAFPLSPEYCVVLFGEGLLEESMFEKKSIVLERCDKGFVDYINSIQCASAYRLIFPCSTNSYLIRHMLKNNPELLNRSL